MAQVATKETEPTKSEMLEMLLSTGRYEYEHLIGYLYSAEKQRIRK